MYNPKMANAKIFKFEMLKVYKSWRNIEVYCPAFKENVYFTLLGWNHIVGNSKKHRSQSDVYRRLKLLPLAKDIISRSGTIQSIKVVNNITMYALDSIETIEVNGVKVTTKIRVIVLQTKSGKKFLSIMDRKIR